MNNKTEDEEMIDKLLVRLKDIDYTEDQFKILNDFNERLNKIKDEIEIIKYKSLLAISLNIPSDKIDDDVSLELWKKALVISELDYIGNEAINTVYRLQYEINSLSKLIDKMNQLSEEKQIQLIKENDKEYIKAKKELDLEL